MAQELLDTYQIKLNKTVVNVTIQRDTSDTVPHYIISLINISRGTQLILNKIRDEFVSKNVIVTSTQDLEEEDIRKKFEQEIQLLIAKYFPNIDSETMDLLIAYLIQQNIGLGELEIVLKDAFLEEIVVNSAEDPVWVYHKKYGWLKTNIKIENEARVRYYATMIGKDIGKEITLLNPLMDAHLKTGDRVNATLQPISSRGNTITIRKFSEKPWSVIDLINARTIDFNGAALVWMGIQNEFSMIVAGGTGSGKTSFLNAVANFFPPNHRIISIEDTRELTLPHTLHWVPMETRLPNPEGKGEVSMLDLVVNSLRQRPDRIMVGEIRKKKEAEVLFEAMHTGHSVYGTLHANNVEETYDRLTNPPIELPKKVLSAIGMIVVQNRNRRTGHRRTFQIAEMKDDGTPSVIYQHNVKNDSLNQINPMKKIYETLDLYTGLTQKEIDQDLKEKVEILKWLHKKDINDVHKIGKIMAHYYYKKSQIGKKDVHPKKEAEKKEESKKAEAVPVPSALRDFKPQSPASDYIKSPFEMGKKVDATLDELGRTEMNPFMQRPPPTPVPKADKRPYSAAFDSSLLDDNAPKEESKDQKPSESKEQEIAAAEKK
jgi:archaeal flagellar protein FlaI